MFIYVPEKGRNAGIALEQELSEEFDTEFILDVLNGVGKLYAKRGLNRHWVERAVERLESVEFKDTGRNFRRPVFTSAELEDKTVESYQANPVNSTPDEFYQGFDHLVEENYSTQEINKSFNEVVEETAAENGYQLVEVLGDEVKWGAMNTDLETEPETVLIPQEFQSLGIAAAERYWNSTPDYSTFSEYRSNADEEEILAESSEEVAGVYMFVSGNTAEEAGLEYEAVNGMTSRLGRFQRTQNQYKNSERIFQQEATQK
ncbi:MAG: hypothetical protein ACLFTA_01835 [Candidatus Nanohaloarchaea archaeon]